MGNVLFTAEKIDPESGFQQRSLVEVYSTIVEDGVYNLIHMHVEDTSDITTIDVVTIAGDIPKQTLKDFGLDSAGRPLRYKVMVKNNHVVSVLYNTGSSIEPLKYQEQQFVKGEYVFLEDTQTFAKILSLPVYLLSSDNPEKIMKYTTEQPEFSQNGECLQRGFVDLPGFVDLEILSEEAGETFNVAVPICRCLKLDEEKTKEMASMKLNKEEKVKNDALSIIKKMRDVIQSYETAKATMKIENKEEIAKELTKSEADLVGLSETQEFPEDIKAQFKEQCDKSYGIVKEIISEIRVHRLTAKQKPA